MLLKMRWFFSKGNGRFIRILSRIVQKLKQENEKPTTALYIIVPTCVIPLLLFRSHFTPIADRLDRIKKKNGIENGDGKYCVDADTRTLLQEVIDDLKVSELPSQVYLPSLEFEVYPCKGQEIVLHHLSQISLSAPFFRRMLAIGVPEYMISSSSSVTPSPTLSRPTDIGSTLESSSELGARKSDGVSLKSLNVQSQNSLEEKADNEKSEVLEFKPNLSTEEKKFLFFRHISSWILHTQTTGRLMLDAYMLSLIVFLLLKIRQLYIYILLNIVGFYLLSLEYQFLPERRIMGTTRCRYSSYILSERPMRNANLYLAGGKTYCMKKLKHNYSVYEHQQERARNSQTERLKLTLCVLFYRFIPHLETVYNRGGGIRSWPVNYFNYDFFWAQFIRSEFDKRQRVSPKWREWVSSCCVASPDTVESQLNSLPSDRLNQVPLIFQSVLIPLNKDKMWDFAAPKSEKTIGRQAQCYLKSFGLYRHSTSLNSLASPSTDVFNC